MESKKVLLALNPELYKLVKSRAEKEYMNVQQYVYDLLRRNVLASEAKKSGAKRQKGTGDFYTDIFTKRR